MGLADAKRAASLFRARAAAAPAERRPAGHGDELQELAETFRVTVGRLSSLVTELDAAHQQALQVEADKKRFYSDVIRSVTGGKLELVDPESIPDLGEPEAVLQVSDGAGYAAARKAIRDAATAAGMSEERADDLILAAGEAITNTMKHAQDGCCEVYRRDESVYVRVTDRGTGIGSQVLPQAILMPGFSTKISLGMGYKMVLRLCDRVWLATSPEGTTVLMQKRVESSPEEGLAAGLLSRL
jgi:anti-sigma regulatory factor (Ser/Thr protein kinase)